MQSKRSMVSVRQASILSVSLVDTHLLFRHRAVLAKIVKNGQIEVRLMDLHTQQVLNAQFNQARETWRCAGSECRADVSIWNNKCDKCSRKRMFGSSRVRINDRDWLCSMYVAPASIHMLFVFSNCSRPLPTIVCRIPSCFTANADLSTDCYTCNASLPPTNRAQFYKS